MKMKMIPVFEEMRVINGIIWGLTKISDGYLLFTDYGDSGELHPIAHFLTTGPDVELRFHHDENGNHIGVVNANGSYDDIPISSEEPFSSFFSDC
jgi:hypothetical protein